MWEAVLNRVAAEAQGRLWDMPCWVVEDSRHRRKAEVALMGALGVTALPTQGVCTLASLAGEVLRHHPQNLVVTAAAASLLLAEILGEDCPDVYRASADKPGFTEAFWRSLGDAESRGFFPDFILLSAEGPPPAAFTSLQGRLHQRLEKQSRCTPGQFLLRALRQLQDSAFQFEVSSPLFLGPMLRRSPLEREFIGQLAARAQHVILAPAQGGSLETLLPRDLARSVVPASHPPSSPPPHLYFLRPTTPEAELDAIFAIISRWAAEKRFRYRDIRVVHPKAQETLPQILSAAGRYHVPVKAGIGHELKDFPGVISLRRLLYLFESNWDRQNLLDLLHSRVLAAADGEKSAMIKAMLKGSDPRSRPPWVGWVKLAKKENAPALAKSLGKLQELDKQRGNQTGAAFASWVRELARFIRQSQQGTDPQFFAVQEQTEEQKAWETLDAVLDDLSRCFPNPLPRSRLIVELDRTLALSRYLPTDYRLDAVEIASGYQDDFRPAPVVIYVGLTSAVPAPDHRNPFFTDQKPTSYDEKLRLFRQITSNAQDALLLSCPRFEDDGDELAQSPFLSIFPEIDEGTVKKESDDLLIQAESWQPQVFLTSSLRGRMTDPESRQQIPLRRSPYGPTPLNKGGQMKYKVVREAPLAFLADQSHSWSTSRLNNALQCRYLHFAAEVLKLEPRVDAISEAATPLLMGTIAHEVLKDYISNVNKEAGYHITHKAREIFQEKIRSFDPHPELDRAGAELIRCLTNIAPQLATLAEGFFSRDDRLEVNFGRNKKGNGFPALIFNLQGLPLLVQGAIDRLDTDNRNNVLVIEYKYKADNESQTEFFKAILAGDQPQLPLYWRAAQEVMGLNPVALAQIYLRAGVIRVLKLPEAPLFPGEGEKSGDILTVSPEEIRQMLDHTEAKLLECAVALKNGDLTALPKDYTHCGPAACAYADLCRFREAP